MTRITQHPWIGRRRRLFLLALVLGVFFVGTVCGQTGGVRRFGLFVGANDGGTERVRLRYAVSDAARLADVMFQVGGVAPEDAILLRDPDRDDLDRGVTQITRRMERARSGARRVEFVFYYSGHSDEEGLLLGEEAYTYSDLRGAIRGVNADVAVAMLDSCSSGSFTRLKGGRRAQPFLIHDSSEMSGYAFLTSSSDDEASQESDQIGASFFTHYLVSGLLGAADHTRDGKVTLNEVYQYAFTETLAQTARTFAGPQHPSYEIQLTGAGDLVLTDLTIGDTIVTLRDDVAGRIFVRSEAGGRVLAEFEKYAGESVDIALEPGRYSVELRSAEGMLVAPVVVTPGIPIAVDAGEFSSMRYERYRIRGDGAEEGLAESFDQIRRRADDAVTTIGSAARGAFGGGDPGVSTFVAADRSGLVREPFAVDIVPGMRIVPRDSVPEGESLHHLVLGLPVADSGYTDGVVASIGMNVGTGVTRGWEGSYLGNIRRGRVHGMQQSSLFNIHDGEIRGVQVASVFNVTDGSIYGVQTSSVANVVDGEIRGVQASGVAGIAGYAVRGVQLGGVFSMSPRVRGVQGSVVTLARDVRGVQMGVVNGAERVRGVQVGVVNLAREVDGATIGVINIVRFGVLDLALTIDDRGMAWAAFEHGTESLYTVYQVGARQPDLESDRVEYASAAGLGTRIWSGTLYLDIDASAMVMGPGGDGFDHRASRVFPSLRLSGGIQFGPRFAIMGGVRFDGLINTTGQEASETHEGYSFSVAGDGIDVFPTVFGGIKI
ncbi:MAG: caspase family protein [Alkalispirochaeta sp.]